jgi:hypothetical protein
MLCQYVQNMSGKGCFFTGIRAKLILCKDIDLVFFYVFEVSK